jgi:hypothetical protein
VKNTPLRTRESKKAISTNKECEILSNTHSDEQQCSYIFKETRFRTSLVSIILILLAIPILNAEGQFIPKTKTPSRFLKLTKNDNK